MIDDSATMNKHWMQVVELAKLLIYMTKTMDPDGVELFFLSSGKTHKFRNASDAISTIVSHPRSGMTTLNDRLGQDTGAYCSKLNGYLRGGRFFQQRAPRKRSVYIFTDGILGLGEDQQGQKHIQNLVQKLSEASLGRDHFGIQFIQFGNDRAGKARLEALDNLKHTLRLNM